MFVYDGWKRSMCQEVKGQLCGASFLLPCFRGSWSANEGHQACTVSSFTWDALLAPQTQFPWQKGCALFGIIFSLSAWNKSVNWTVHTQRLRLCLWTHKYINKKKPSHQVFCLLKWLFLHCRPQDFHPRERVYQAVCALRKFIPCIACLSLKLVHTMH